MKSIIMSCLYQGWSFLLKLIIDPMLEITFEVPNKAPFIHLLLCFISTVSESGASVHAFASGTY
jgi:hypothetical protein